MPGLIHAGAFEEQLSWAGRSKLVTPTCRGPCVEADGNRLLLAALLWPEGQKLQFPESLAAELWTQSRSVDGI